MMADDVVVTVRVPKTLVQRARQVADSRDETMSQVIRRSLRGYVGRAPKSIENEDAA
jgi:predicted transcriptional regulator